MTVNALSNWFGAAAWRHQWQEAIALTFSIIVSATSGTAFAEEGLPAPSNIEDAKSDILQLDRDLALLEQRALLPERTTFLFGLSAKSRQYVSQLQIRLDGRTIAEQRFNDEQVDSLRKGGMATLWDKNLGVGKHKLEISLTETTSGQLIRQQFEFNKKNPRTLMALQLQERPAPNSPPIKLIEWTRND